MKKCPLCENPMYFYEVDGPPMDERGVPIFTPIIPSGTTIKYKFGKLKCSNCNYETFAFDTG